MALNKADFQQAFVDFFTAVQALPATFETAGEKWASLYAAYATNALAGVTLPTHASIVTAQDTLGKALAKAFESVASGRDLAPKMAEAFSVFWQAIVFEARAAIGKVTEPHLLDLQNSLAGFFFSFDPKANPPTTAEQQANDLVSRFDAWTQTVTVVNTISGQIQPAVTLT